MIIYTYVLFFIISNKFFIVFFLFRSLYIHLISRIFTYLFFLGQVFIIIHVVALVYYIKGILSPKMFKVAVALVVSVGL